MKTPSRHLDVIIVGLGPTGATLANLLGVCGVSTLVIERETDVHPLPRAVHFDDEVMRVFQAIGVADEVSAVVRINPGMRFVDANGALLLDWPRPAEIGPNGWHASYRFHQPDLERVLRKALSGFECVDVQTGANVLEMTDRGTDVCVRYEDVSSGEIHHRTAAYVVGCDGARSVVRGAIGTSMQDLGFHERWLVTDVILKQPKPELGDHTIQYCNPARPATYVRCPGDRRRWEIAVLDDEPTDGVSTAASVWNLLAPWLSPQEAELERTAVYTFHSTIATQWRRGLLLLAGDAAHQTPPFMGQGMCAGIRDVANLAWKLGHCVNEQHDSALLDSYQQERFPHALEYIETAIRLGGLINACGTREALRAALPQADGSARMKSISPRLGPGLGAGSTEHTGRFFPQPAVSGGRLMDDICGYSWALLADRELLEGAGSVQAALSGSGICVLATESEPGIRQCLQQLDTRAVLVRPDRYVLGSAADEAELSALVRSMPTILPKA